MYRKYLIQKCKEKDKADLRKMAEGKTKCEKIMADKYCKKYYLSINVLKKVRQHSMSRVKMQHFAGNFPKDRRFENTNWRCRCQKEIKSENHLISGQCQVYEDLRGQFSNLEDDTQLVNFFSAVLDRRGRLEEKDRRTEDKKNRDGFATDSS